MEIQCCVFLACRQQRCTDSVGFSCGMWMVWHGRHSGLGLGGKLEMGLQSTNARSALLLAVQTQLPSSCAGTGGERLPPRRSSSGSQARAAKGKEA